MSPVVRDVMPGIEALYEYVGKFSFRAWGDLMAAIATVKDGKDHNYMEFYC